MASCSNELDVPVSQAVVGKDATPLSINVLANPTTKAQITGDKLPNESKIGVTLIATGVGDELYDSHEYKNIYYSTTDGSTWAIDNTKSILLSATDGTVYAYYPYDVNVTDIEHISINATDGTDYMYAEPVSGIKNSNAAAQLTMKHALSVVKFTIQKATSNGYTGAGEITKVKLEGATMGSEGFMNIKTQAVNASAGTMTYTSQLKLNPADVSETNQAQVFAVPTGTQSAIKFTVTMDGQDYTATTGDVTLASGQQYSYTLNMSSTGLTVNTVTVTEWGNAPATEPMDTQLATLTDGVYAIKADGTLVAAGVATEDSYAGVGFIVNGKKYQVAKVDAVQAENTENTALVYWQKVSPTNIGDLTDYTTADGTNEIGLLPFANGSYYSGEGFDEFPKLSGVWSEWHSYGATAALADFDGKENTEKIMAAHGTTDFTIAKTVKAFRSNGSYNDSKTDWFVPSCGELAFMIRNVTYINTILTKVTGAAIFEVVETGGYWSSSEYSSDYAWIVYFSTGLVCYNDKNYNYRLRLIRAM